MSKNITLLISLLNKNEKLAFSIKLLFKDLGVRKDLSVIKSYTTLKLQLAKKK